MSTPRRFDLYVFDLDGTLIDSRRDLAIAVNALLVECGVPALSEEAVGRMVGDGAAVLIARAFEASGVRPPADALPRFLAIYDRHLTDWTRPYEGIGDALASLGASATLALLTNKPLAATRTILQRLDLARYFPDELVFGGDGPFARKPDPAGLLELIRRAGTDRTRSILVGDSVIDWRTARAADTAICVVRYGFGFEGLAERDSPRVDFVVDKPAGLLSL